MDLEQKQRQFNHAMQLYCTRARYRLFGTLVSTVNVSFQLYLLYLLLPLSIGPGWQTVAFCTAFVLADLINGLVHMFMDNNDRYDSIAGPLIANFHLHHRTPRYKKRPLYSVYFNESGSKIWLAGYLFAVWRIVESHGVNPVVAYLLVYVGILSSVAEVSHYLCHSSTSTLSIFLARIGVLLSKRHHATHHIKDNTHYAFLNGCTNPLINAIARYFYSGYKTTTDRHYACYVSGDGESR